MPDLDIVYRYFFAFCDTPCGYTVGYMDQPIDMEHEKKTKNKTDTYTLIRVTSI